MAMPFAVLKKVFINHNNNVSMCLYEREREKGGAL